MKKLPTKTQFLLLCLISCTLCLIPNFRAALAQEDAVRVQIKLDPGERIEGVEAADDIVIIDPEIIYIDNSLREQHADEIEAESRKEGDQSEDRFPPEVRKMMEEEGISPEDLMKDPELRGNFREKVEQHMEAESGEDAQSGKGSGEEKKRDPKEDGKIKDGATENGLERYTNAIVKKNLFRQLGSGGENKGPSYALTAVISDASGVSSNKAIIERQGGGESYYVSEGDTFAGKIEVLDIEDKKVKLDNSGEEMTLTLGVGSGGGGGGRGGRGGGGRQRGGGNRNPGGGENQSSEGGNSNNNRRGQRGGGNINIDNIPPAARRMLEERGISIDQLRNDPNLQQELRREFLQRFRDGGGRRRIERRIEIP